MPAHGLFSPAQLVGYLAFALGVYSFLQKDDRRLKKMIGVQASSYALHFLLLGSLVAAAASLITAVRAALSLYTRSRYVAFAILATHAVLGLLTAKGLAGWLPIVASSLGTIGFFFLEGIRLRLILLHATACWLANNLLVGSIGGTLLELFLGAVNATTSYRLWRAERRAASPAD